MVRAGIDVWEVGEWGVESKGEELAGTQRQQHTDYEDGVWYTVCAGWSTMPLCGAVSMV